LQLALARPAGLDALKARLGELVDKAGGKMGVSVLHVESGQGVTLASGVARRAEGD
jgi:hypothetical protein